MVLEKITGGELLDRISERDRYREEDARKAIQETLMAVEHLHERGVVHRDIKPENLLLLNKDGSSFSFPPASPDSLASPLLPLIPLFLLLITNLQTMPPSN
jgi:serine/threonine protein kinase